MSGSPRGRVSAGRNPWPQGAARSDSGVASIHSSVSTSLVVRSQSTAGTRKSGSSLVFSAISESAAASRRKSISTITERRSVSTTSMSRSRRASARQILRRARGEGESVEVGVKAPFDAGPQHFDGDARGPSAVSTVGAMHLRDRGGGDRRAEAAKTPLAAACRTRRRPPLRPRPAGTAASGPAAARDRARAPRRPRPAASPETGRA